MRVLILEDDVEQAALLKAWLEEAGHYCYVAYDAKAFLKSFGNESFDLVMLDWMVPKGSGIEVLATIREHFGSAIPVVFMTARDAEADIVKALEEGADDYIVKPLRQAETLARINALARRGGDIKRQASEPVSLPPYEIDTESRSISIEGQPIDFTQKEYELAVFLFKNAGRVVSRGHMLEMVWATSPNLNTRTVDTHMSRLRTKLRLDDQPNWRLTSIYRHGYRLEQVGA